MGTQPQYEWAFSRICLNIYDIDLYSRPADYCSNLEINGNEIPDDNTIK